MGVARDPETSRRAAGAQPLDVEFPGRQLLRREQVLRVDGREIRALSLFVIIVVGLGGRHPCERVRRRARPRPPRRTAEHLPCDAGEPLRHREPAACRAAPPHWKARREDDDVRDHLVGRAAPEPALDGTHGGARTRFEQFPNDGVGPPTRIDPFDPDAEGQCGLLVCTTEVHWTPAAAVVSCRLDRRLSTDSKRAVGPGSDGRRARAAATRSRADLRAVRRSGSFAVRRHALGVVPAVHTCPVIVDEAACPGTVSHRPPSQSRAPPRTDGAHWVPFASQLTERGEPRHVGCTTAATTGRRESTSAPTGPKVHIPHDASLHRRCGRVQGIRLLHDAAVTPSARRCGLSSDADGPHRPVRRHDARIFSDDRATSTLKSEVPFRCR